MSGPDRATIEKINQERLASWGRRLAENHATPLLLVGVGHGARSGQINLCVCAEDLPVEDVRAMVALLYQTVVERADF